jgi:hypoxanthine phosphoribosyltransferase
VCAWIRPTWRTTSSTSCSRRAQIQERLAELAKDIEADYEGKDLLIVGILRGAVMVMADLARSFSRHLEMDWMAVTSYGSGTKSSGVVRILKDLDTDISGRHVVIVDEIIDTGLTLSWLTSNLSSRNPAKRRDLHAAAQARGAADAGRGTVRRLGHPQRVRGRLRPRLPRALPQTCATSAPSLRTSTPERFPRLPTRLREWGVADVVYRRQFS